MQNAEVKISVIIPLYNTPEEILRRCVDSMIGQSLKELEIILVDDGSTNGILRVLEEYQSADPRVRVLTQTNSYAGNARNNGMRSARGKYLCFFDSDDYCDTDFLETLYRTAEENGSDMVFCGEEFFDIDLDLLVPGTPVEVATPPFDQNRFNRSDTPDCLFQLSNGWPWDKLFRRSFVVENGLKFAPSRTANDGYFVFMAMALADVISRVDERLVVHRMGGGHSLSNTRETTWRDGMLMLYDIKKSLVDHQIYETVKKSFLNYCLFYISWAVENMLPGTGRDNLYRELNTVTEGELCIEEQGASFYYDDALFEKYLFIRRNPIDRYAAKYDLSFPYDRIPPGSRIVLYAAGKYGKLIYRELRENRYAEVVLWMDRKFEGIAHRNSDGVLLGGLDCLKSVEFDAVVFTLSNRSIFEQVKESFVKAGIPSDKLIALSGE